MKKIVAVILILVACILLSFISAYNTYKAEKKELYNYNNEYEYYYNREILGNELATIINKVSNNNTKYKVQKDNNGNYIENEKDSIKMDIYIIDTDLVYPIEKIYSLGTERFVQNFTSAKFKCTKIEYHEKSKKIKYLYFEQTSN